MKTRPTQFPIAASASAIAFQVGYRYYADGPNYGPDWGLRFTVTFLFPKKQ